MSRYTSAYSSFLQRLDEIEILRRSAHSLVRSDPILNRRKIDALCRAAIVLLSSHIEAYVKELGEVALESMVDKQVDRSILARKVFYHISKEIIDALTESADADVIADRTFSFIATDSDLWSRSGGFPRAIPAHRFNKGFSNPKFDKIRSYFNRFGYHEYKHELQARLKADSGPIINILDHLVDVRNSIAHGDPSASKTPVEIKEIVDLIKIYCRTTDDLFSDWCRRSLCGIRN